MNKRDKAVFLCTLALLTSGCGWFSSRSGATLDAPAVAAPDEAPKTNIFQQAGDTTWRVVTAPARWVAPKAPDKKEPVTYDAPMVTIEPRPN